MNNPEALIIGNAYFMISFFDNEGRIPEITTYIYVGKNLLNQTDEKDTWYFQHPSSYLSKGPFNILPPGDYGIYQISSKELEMIYGIM